MSEPDPVIILLTQSDHPVTPSPEFAQVLRTRLLAELAAPDGVPARRLAPRTRLTLPPRRRQTVRRAREGGAEPPVGRQPSVRPSAAVKLLAATASALAVAAAAITAVLLPRPSSTALEVIHQARQAFATAPPFQAMLRVNLNPDGSNPGVPRGETEALAPSRSTTGGGSACSTPRAESSIPRRPRRDSRRWGI